MKIKWNMFDSDVVGSLLNLYTEKGTEKVWLSIKWHVISGIVVKVDEDRYLISKIQLRSSRTRSSDMDSTTMEIG